MKLLSILFHSKLVYNYAPFPPTTGLSKQQNIHQKIITGSNQL